MKIRIVLLTALLCLSALGQQIPTKMTQGNVTVIVKQSTGMGFPVTFLLACSRDSRTTGFSIVANFVTTSLLLHVAAVPASPGDGWTYCAVAAAPAPIAAIQSLDIGESQDNKQTFLFR